LKETPDPYGTLLNLEDALYDCRLLSKDENIISIFAAPGEEGYYEIKQALENAKERNK
jgi:hypothetical protein